MKTTPTKGLDLRQRIEECIETIEQPQLEWKPSQIEKADRNHLAGDVELLLPEHLARHYPNGKSSIVMQLETYTTFDTEWLASILNKIIRYEDLLRKYLIKNSVITCKSNRSHNEDQILPKIAKISPNEIGLVTSFLDFGDVCKMASLTKKLQIIPRNNLCKAKVEKYVNKIKEPIKFCHIINELNHKYCRDAKSTEQRFLKHCLQLPKEIQNLTNINHLKQQELKLTCYKTLLGFLLKYGVIDNGFEQRDSNPKNIWRWIKSIEPQNHYLLFQHIAELQNAGNYLTELAPIIDYLKNPSFLKTKDILEAIPHIPINVCPIANLQKVAKQIQALEWLLRQTSFSSETTEFIKNNIKDYILENPLIYHVKNAQGKTCLELPLNEIPETLATILTQLKSKCYVAPENNNADSGNQLLQNDTNVNQPPTEGDIELQEDDIELQEPNKQDIHYSLEVINSSDAANAQNQLDINYVVSGDINSHHEQL